MSWDLYDTEEVGPVIVFTSTQRARKEHTCDDCGGTIRVGQRYDRVASMCDGSWHTQREHGWCAGYDPEGDT